MTGDLVAHARSLPFRSNDSSSSDMKAYGDTMADDAILIAASGNVCLGKQKILADRSSESDPSEVKSFDLGNTKVRQLSHDIAVLTYNLTQDVTCKATGKLAAKAFVTSIYVRQGGK
jgi:ketosteroid isomerase-like protein